MTRLMLLQEKRFVEKRKRNWAANWDGSYGYGAGKANPCVEHVWCPWCKAKKGQLCIGSFGPHFDTHVARRESYQRLKGKR